MVKLFLDDNRTAPEGWVWVKNYTEFVSYITQRGVPDVISFDHDLGFEHYPLGEQNPSDKIPYDTYGEKTGYHCAKWLIENYHAPRIVIVHSFNVVGARNIMELFHRYSEAKILRYTYRFPFKPIVETLV